MFLTWFIRPAVLLPLVQLHLYPFDDLSHLLPGAFGQPGVVNAVLQVLVSFPTGTALP
ncbi:MAG: hypothetical protein ACXWET_05755 [Halobacteriota archaeon]